MSRQQKDRVLRGLEITLEVIGVLLLVTQLLNKPKSGKKGK